MPERQTPTSSGPSRPPRESPPPPPPQEAPPAEAPQRIGRPAAPIVRAGPPAVAGHGGGDEPPPPPPARRRRKKPKHWLEFACEWLREASVLVLVFGLLDPLRDKGWVSLRWALGLVGVSVVTFLAAIWAEHVRPHDDDDDQDDE